MFRIVIPRCLYFQSTFKIVMMFRSFRPFSALNVVTMKSYSSGPYLPVAPCDPGVNISILHNGIRVATEYKPSPIACMSLLVEAGPRFETAYMNGVTHFLGHMAYKGFCGMHKCAFEDTLDQIGAKMWVDTSREMQTFSGVFLSECYPQMLDNLAAVVTNLELNSNDIEDEKCNICLEMVDEDNDPKSVVFDYLHQTAFQGTPLAQRVIGTSANVKRFDHEQLRMFYSQHYQPFKFSLSTSGPISHEHMVSLVSKRLGHLCGNPSFESDDGPIRYTGSQVTYRNDDMPFAHVAIAFEAPGYSHPNYWKCLIAKQIIGNWHKSQGGMYNHASQTARAAAVDDLADSFESFYITYRDVGLWGIYFVSKRLDIDDMMANIQDHWKHMALMSQFTDVQRGLNATKLQLAREMSGVINSCKDMGTQLFYRCSRMALEDKLVALEKIKVKELSEFVEEMIYDKCPVVVAVGPTENLPDYVRTRDNQCWLRY